MTPQNLPPFPKTIPPLTYLGPDRGRYGSGVGGGVQITSTQRLLILAEERVGPFFNSVPVLSDDHGKTWRRGARDCAGGWVVGCPRGGV